MAVPIEHLSPRVLVQIPNLDDAVGAARRNATTIRTGFQSTDSASMAAERVKPFARMGVRNMYEAVKTAADDPVAVVRKLQAL